MSATRTAARVGTAFAVLFALVGVLAFSPLLLVLALFVYGAAASESRAVVLSELLDGMTVGDVAAQGRATIVAETTVDDLVSRTFADRRTEYVVTEDGRPVGVVTSTDFRSLSPAERAESTVGSLVDRDLPRLAADVSAFDALAALDSSRATAALVESPDGARVVSREDFADAMSFRRMVGADEPF